MRAGENPVSVRSMRGLATLFVGLLLLATGRVEAQRGTYVVRTGDTLAEIARRHHVSIAALQSENRLRRTNLRPGERLRIPPAPRLRNRIPARQYSVRAGDTLARIARRFRTTVEDVRAANALRSERLRPGTALWIPHRGHSGAEVRYQTREGNAPVVPDAPPPIAVETAEQAAARARELGLGPTHIGQRLLREGASDPRWVEAAGRAEDVDGTMLLPVDAGRYLRGWGSGMGGYHLAVDIGAPSGTEIRAVARGLVGYVGRGIRGYGNFVILVHPNGWVTAYAHNRQNLVAVGQLVSRGDVLATVGETGFAQGPHLHFILVHEGHHCDPMPLFRPTPARPTGEPIETLELVWDTEHRPSGIRCLYRSDAPHPLHSSRHRRRRR